MKDEIKDVGVVLYRVLEKWKLELPSLKSLKKLWPVFLKYFLSFRPVLHPLPSCAVSELIAIIVKAELAPEGIFRGQ